MTRQGLRTRLCTTASMVGLWAVAVGVLAHHPMAVKLGAAVVAIGALMVFTGPADAREFSAQDIRTIENVQVAYNAWGETVHVSGGADGPCAIIADSKAMALLERGFAPSDIGIALVLTREGKRHAVTFVQGTVNGKSWKRYLDNRLPTLADATDLFRVYGYRLRGEVGVIAASQSENGR